MKTHAGYRVVARMIDALFIYGIYFLFPKPAADSQSLLFLLYLLYYGSAAFIDGLTPGRYVASTNLKITNGETASFWRLILRDILFIILLPLIFFQWVFGLDYAHERITSVIQTRRQRVVKDT